ncbi:hypothetical protein LOD99_8153 [Oopsacas minuta]|uniref:Tc1-like transposase DDE domain-containing protein n=1 Tax=Oopsacas minuta TaxID=111878 RepID=A0AAV7JJ69_9METZ|nr:hypothetical protein LOD99_8153 [Oopsacas minuta]
MFSGQPFVFQQDGAPAHTANTTQDWMKHNTPNFIHKDEWPPYSPDLNPMDYSVWSILENKACSVSHNTVSSLKISLCREWEKIPQETACRSRRIPEQTQGCHFQKGWLY